MSDGTSDTEKLMKAFNEVTTKFGSLENLLEAMGLANLPTAQRYGIFFGCLVFIGTITAVVALLIFGGTFQRIVEQSQKDDGLAATIPHAYKARNARPLLLERLLEARKRMIMKYEAPVKQEDKNNSLTPLTKMLLNVAPVKESNESDDSNNSHVDEKKEEKADDRVTMPPNYQTNYAIAYRKCQDKPGGEVLSGRPEARFEAYARAYAGCGDYTNLSYRRSYARMYEAVACTNHNSDTEFLDLWKKRPQDIIGRYIRLEPLEIERHLDTFFEITKGDTYAEFNSFDPNEIWSFLPEGPFTKKEQLKQSYIFQNNVKKLNAASFAIVTNITNKFIGIIQLTNDDPYNLSIQIEPPILPPYRDDTREQMEPVFLLMDRLFAYGYRRIQMSTDTMDQKSRKLASRLGYTLEGQLYKHMIIKEANRDSHIFGMLNSDWDKGARFALYKKLYGEALAKGDQQNNKKEEELDIQNNFLEEQKKLSNKKDA